MIRHQFGQVEFASEHWFRLAATTLASATESAGLATPAKPAAARLRRVDIVGIHERLASLILVLREGTVKQQLINLDEPHSHETARGGRRARQRAPRRPHRRPDRTPSAAPRCDGRQRRRRCSPRRVGERILRTMREFDAEKIEEVFSDGLLNVLAAPEFAQSEKVRRVFSALENRAYLGDLVGSVGGGAGVSSVFIGEENPTDRDARGLPRARAVRAARPRRRSSSVSSGQRACRTRRRSAP